MLYITVKLFGRNGIRGEFKEYEKIALNIFKKYGGEVVVAYKPSKEFSQTDVPDEIQILRISNRTDFDAFMNDSDRTRLANLRDDVIRKTDVYFSEEIIDY